jgi:hypothetical protein
MIHILLILLLLPYTLMCIVYFRGFSLKKTYIGIRACSFGSSVVFGPSVNVEKH